MKKLSTNPWECKAISDEYERVNRNRLALPLWDEKAEHENDLRWESRQDYASWERDGDTGTDNE